MCGIVGLFAKSTDVEERLGEHLAAMLTQMNDRGPDSAGVAVYRNPAPAGSSKLSLYSADPREDWDRLAAELGGAYGASEPDVRASHAVLVVDAGRTPLKMAQRAVDAIGADRIMGCVLNRVNETFPSHTSDYYQYYGSRQ